MRAIFKLIGYLFVFIFIAVLGLSVYVVVQVSDSADNTIVSVRENNLSTKEVLSREMCISLDSVSSDSDFVFMLDELDMNELLFSFVEPLNKSGVYVSGAYFEYRDSDKLHLEVNGKVGFFSSRLQGTLKVEFVEKNLVFKLIDASLGNLEVINNFIVKSLIRSLKIPNEDSLNCSIDLDNLTISFSENNVLSIIDSFVNSDSKYLYNLLVHIAFSNDGIVDFCFGENGKLGFVLHSTNLVNEGYVSYGLNLDSADIKALSLYKESKANLDNLSSVFNYYVLGYDSLSSYDKAIVDELNLSDKENGVKDFTKVKFNDIIASKIEGISSNKIDLLTEDDFNLIFASLDMIGTSFAFSDSNKISYISIESLTSDISNNKLVFHLAINLNGFRTYLSVDFIQKSSHDLSMTLGVESIRFGNISLDDNSKNYFIRYLSMVLENEDWISFDNNDDLLLNFSFNSSGLKDVEKTLSLKDGIDNKGVLELEII